MARNTDKPDISLNFDRDVGDKYVSDDEYPMSRDPTNPNLFFKHGFEDKLREALDQCRLGVHPITFPDRGSLRTYGYYLYIKDLFYDRPISQTPSNLSLSVRNIVSSKMGLIYVKNVMGKKVLFFRKEVSIPKVFKSAVGDEFNITMDRDAYNRFYKCIRIGLQNVTQDKGAHERNEMKKTMVGLTKFLPEALVKEIERYANANTKTSDPAAPLRSLASFLERRGTKRSRNNESSNNDRGGKHRGGAKTRRGRR